MSIYNFTLFFEGPDITSDENLDALQDAECDDALFGERGSQQYAEFDRQAPSFADAILDAIRSTEEAVPGLMVVRVEPDDLVSQSVIAERTGRTRASIGLLVSGKRGSKDFPEPVGWISTRNRVWQWSEVAEWFERHEGQSVALGGAPQYTAALNGALEARRQIRKLSDIAEEHISNGTTAATDLAFTPEAVAELPTLIDEGAKELSRELTPSS